MAASCVSKFTPGRKASNLAYLVSMVYKLLLFRQKWLIILFNYAGLSLKLVILLLFIMSLKTNYEKSGRGKLYL
jgi:predicted membrane protein